MPSQHQIDNPLAVKALPRLFAPFYWQYAFHLPKPAVSKLISKNTSATDRRFEHIQAFFETTRGQITIGEIPPIRCAALAAVGKKARVALVCGETERMRLKICV